MPAEAGISLGYGYEYVKDPGFRRDDGLCPPLV